MSSPIMEEHVSEKNTDETINIELPRQLKRSGKSGMVLSLALMLAASIALFIAYGVQHIALLWLGALLGFTFYRSGYGFTRAWRQLVTKESTIGCRAHLLWIAVASVLIFPVFKGVFGLSASDITRPVSVMLFAGSFLFGIGMQVAGSCTSGSMYRAGSGQIRLWFSLIGIVIGAFFAAEHYGFWSRLPQYFIYSYQREFPFWIALGIQLGLVSSLWVVLILLERRFKGGKATGLFGLREDRVSLAQVRKDGRLSLPEGGLLYGRWSLAFGSIVLGVLSLLVVLVLNRPWVISIAFPFWGALIARHFGLEFDFEFWDYWGLANNEAMLNRGLFEDPTSLMNMAFIFGAFWAWISLRRFQDDKSGERDYSNIVADFLYRPIITTLGGIFMGYGAVVGLGCNIGGYMGAVISGSVHGWVWVAFALLGTVVGVRLRQILRL